MDDFDEADNEASAGPLAFLAVVVALKEASPLDGKASVNERAPSDT